MAAEVVGPWPGGSHVPLQFAATPVLSRPSDAGTVTPILENPCAWKLNLGAMLSGGTTGGVLSNILCNRPKKAAWSNSLFGFIAAPFSVLAVAILIVELPGVIDWGGELISLVTALGVHR